MTKLESHLRIPLWLDCDPGHDDAIAILLATHLPWFELVGISTVAGNSSLQHTTANAISILTAYGIDDVPVFPGASVPLVGKLHVASDIHGVSGLDGTALLPKPGFGPESPPGVVDSAVLAMAAAVHQYQGTIAIVATGSLTNIANLLKRHPEVADMIKYLSIMGGGINTFNYTPFAEFNIWFDPHAAKAVLQHPIISSKTIMVPLDLTHKALATSTVLDTIRGTSSNSTTNLRQMLYELLTFFALTYKQVFGFAEGPPIHDPLAVAVLLPLYSEYLSLDDLPELDLTFHKYAIDVVLDGEEKGRTILLQEEPQSGIMVAEHIDIQQFWALVYQAISEADSISPMNRPPS